MDLQTLEQAYKMLREYIEVGNHTKKQALMSIIVNI